MMDPQSYLPTSETTLMVHSSWQDNTDRLLPKKQLPREYMKNRRRWLSVGTTLQGMLPFSYLVRICGDAIGLKYPFVSIVNGRGMPKSSQAILKLMSSVKIRYPPNLIPKMAVQSRERITYSLQLKWKVLVSAWNRCTKAFPILRLMVYGGILKKSSNPYFFKKST